MTVISILDSDSNRQALESSKVSLGGAGCALPESAGPRQQAPHLDGCGTCFHLSHSTCKLHKDSAPTRGAAG